MPSPHLRQAVEDMLHDKNPDLARNFNATFTNGSGDVQVALNKYFRHQLSKAPISTLDERECLIDDLDPKQWLKYFGDHVLPTLARFDLPSA